MHPAPSALLAATLAALAAAPALAENTRAVSGSATYLARIALPADAVLVAEARGFHGTLLAESRAASEGRQVPLPFTLALPPGLRAQVRVGIETGGELTFLSDPVTLAAGTSAADLGTLVMAPHRAYGFRAAMQCGDRRFTIGFRSEAVVIESDGGTLELPQVVAASGARFASEDGRNELWNRGDRARVTLDGVELPDCTILAPEEDSWTGQGNEPGWRATITGDRLALVLNYGEDRMDLRLPEPEIVGGAYRYAYPQFGLSLSVEDRACQDDMSGQPYPQTVVLTLPGGRYQGCGGEPMEQLTGPDWRIEDIAGGGVIDASAITLSVGEDGHVSGSAGCNRYMGQLTLQAEGGLGFGPLASTQMACAPALMEQERRFLQALSGAVRFEIDAEGALVFYDQAGTALVRARR